MLNSTELSTLAHLIVEEIQKQANKYNFFTAEEVAKKLNRSVKEVNIKCKNGEITAVKKGNTWYVKEIDLYNFLFEGVSISEKSTAG